MSDRKKILYIITKGNFGGAQRYVFDLTTHIPKSHFEAVVAHGEGEALERKLVEANIRTIRIGSLSRNINIFKDLFSFFEIIKIIRKEHPNVVHLNSSKIGGLGGLAVRLLNLGGNLRLKAIFTGHGWAFNEERPSFQKFLIYILHWVTILLSHSTIAVSKKTADQVKRLPFIKKKIKTIHNGLDTFEMAPQNEARNTLAPQAHERVWIGTISELHKNKGLDYLLKAFALLVPKYANIALVIVGDGEEEENLKNLANELGVEGRVSFVGFKADARKYLSAFDIFTLTSRTEAFPYAPLEAGIASLPVVASWVGGIPEIITNNESGLLIGPENTEKLAQTLEELIVKPELRKTLGENLHSKVVQDFNIKNMVRETIAWY